MYGYTYNLMKPRTTVVKSAVRKTAGRIKVTTTLRSDLWKALQVEAINQDRDANEILEELMAAYLKKTTTTKSRN